MITALLATIGLTVLYGTWTIALLWVGVMLAVPLTPRPETRYGLGRAALVFGAAGIPLAASLLSAGSRVDALSVTGAGTASPPVLGVGLVPELAVVALAWAAAIWLCGVAVLAVRTIGDWRRVRRWLGTLRPARPSWMGEARGAAAEFDVDLPPCYESEDLDSPMVVGLVAPAVILPTDAFHRLSTSDRRALLLHEMAHLEAGHPRKRVLELVAEHLLFFHPLVPVLKRFIERERERMCDERASRHCGSRSAYARALAELELARPRPMSWSLAAGGATLLPRVRWLASHAALRPHPWRSRGAAAVVTLAAALALVTTLATTPHALALTRSTVGGVPDYPYTINAVDPAGEFTLTLLQGRALNATIDGRPVPHGELVQTGRRIRVLDGAQPILSVRLDGRGGISWQPRSPDSGR